MNYKTAFKLFIVATFLILSACNNGNKIAAFDPRFAEHISAYTNGMLNADDKIRIELTTPLPTKNGLPDTTLLENIFEFSPSIKGTCKWLNDRTIIFQPKQPLPHKTFYNGVFHLNKVKKVNDDLQKFHFQFSTFEQHLNINPSGLVATNNFDLDIQQLVIDVKTADVEDTQLLKKTIHVKHDGVEMPVRWEFDSNQKYQYTVYVENIKRKTMASNLEISMNGSSIEALEQSKTQINVPSMYDYTVSNARIKSENDEQVVELEFSEPLLQTQNLDGIITIDGIEHPSFSINGNVVDIYFNDPPLGTKLLKVSSLIKNYKGYKMKEPYSANFEFKPPYPSLRVIGKGCILPNSQGLIFPFQTINLKSVEVRIIKIFENNVHQFLQINDVDGSDGLHRVGKIIKEKKIKLDNDKQNLTKWSKHVINLNELITPDPGSIYRISIKFEKADAIYTCDTIQQNNDDKITEIKAQLPNDEKVWDEDNWNENSFDDYETWEDYGYNYSPCDENFYRGKAVSRNILASDLGIVFKLDENKMAHTFISNMLTTQPIANTEIIFYDYTKQIITKGLTNANGELTSPLNQKPFLLVAKNGKQRGYLKLLDANANSLSKFDIDGEIVQKGIKGFLYAERGVWRPGDSIYLNFVLQDALRKIPNNHPIYFELKDPSGKIIAQKNTTNHVHHTYDFRTATSCNAPTGLYTATVTIGNIEFSKSIPIETVKPNRLKIQIDAANLICENDNSNQLVLKAKWLHGAIAKNLKASIYARVSSTEPNFAGYKNYIFSSPIKSIVSNEINIIDDKLNADGELKFNCNLNLKANAPGMFNASLVTTVFEEAGDFSIDKFSFKYSPFQKYIGLQSPEHTNNYLEDKKMYAFKVACVNQNGQPTESKKINLKIYKIEWRWWYETDADDASAYLTKAGTFLYKDTMLATTNGFTSFNFKSNANGYARYLVVLTDLEGGHQTGEIINFDFSYWQQSNQNHAENASMLSFSADKQNYKTGEKVKLVIPSSSNGKALISIEKGTKVVKTFWLNTTKGKTNFEFIATTDMCPNAYIHVTLTQPHINTINDLPIRMYGIVPIMVDDEATHLHPIISMLDVIQPESKVNITISENSGKPMTYTLAIVDDGLLDLTRFKTPDIWSTFNAKEALGVKTWDMYDNVIGAYSGKLDHQISIGGDGSNDGSNTTKANRFKPVVKYFAPIYLAANQKFTHQFIIPNYIGSVRVMVVAQNENTFGNSFKEVEVSKPLMVLATAPRVVSPNEIISLPVDVFAMKDNIKDVKVELETNEYFSVLDKAQQQIHFEKKGDEIIFYKLKVANKVGIATLKIKATCGNQSAYQQIELDVRMPNPEMATSSQTIINPSKTELIKIDFKNIKGTNKAIIELSNVPPINLDQRLTYLIQYPHGCIEQTTSSVFPQLYLGRLLDIDIASQQKIALNIKKAIQRIQLFQTYSGGFSYWPNESEASEYGSNYAGHFLIEAEKQGYVIPTQLKNKWIKYQQQQAKNWVQNQYGYNRYESNELIQAYRLYTLALCGSADLASMNRLREQSNICATAKSLLALAYQQMGQVEVAKQLIASASWQQKTYKELSYSYGSDVRDKAILLMAFNKLKERKSIEKYADELAVDLNSKTWYSTQETAYLLLSLCEFYGINSTEKSNYSYQLNNGKWTTISNTKVISKLSFNEAEINSSSVLNIKNNGTIKMYVKLVVKGVAMIGDTTVSNKNISLQVTYKNLKNEIINPKAIKQGADFYAEVVVKNLNTKSAIKEMCLNEIFPSGWEIHNSRFLDDIKVKDVRYQDIKDDRVYSYFDIEASGTQTVIIKLKATYVGKFYMPSIYSEAMYDNMIHANSKPMWVEVLR